MEILHAADLIALDANGKYQSSIGMQLHMQKEWKIQSSVRAPHSFLFLSLSLSLLCHTGLSDPFVIVELCPHHLFPMAKSQRTQVKLKTLHPVFDELFYL